MENQQTSRRAVLKTGTAVAGLSALGSLSGCSSLTGNGNSATRIGHVPDGSTFALNFKVGSFLSDSDVRDMMNKLLSETESSPDSVSESFKTIESESNLDPNKITELLMFGTYGSEDGFGAVLWTEWSEDAVDSAIKQAADEPVSTESYGGKTIYKGQNSNDDTGIAVLGDGTYAIAKMSTVKDIIDLRRGDQDPIDGTLRTAYEKANSGMMQFAFEVPGSYLPRNNPNSEIDTDAFRSVDYGYGSLGSDGKQLTINLQTESKSDASDVQTAIDDGLSKAATALDDSNTAPERWSGQIDDVKQSVEATTVSSDGKTVTIENQAGSQLIVLGVGAVVASFVLGLGNQPSTQTPVASFTLDYDSSEKTLRIMHDGGDSISKSELYIRGQGFISTDGVDQTAPGQWRGSASGTQGSAAAVVAGDNVTVGVESDYEISVIWQSTDGNRSVTLATAEGPDV